MTQDDPDARLREWLAQGQTAMVLQEIKLWRARHPRSRSMPGSAALLSEAAMRGNHEVLASLVRVMRRESAAYQSGMMVCMAKSDAKGLEIMLGRGGTSSATLALRLLTAFGKVSGLRLQPVLDTILSRIAHPQQAWMTLLAEPRNEAALDAMAHQVGPLEWRQALERHAPILIPRVHAMLLSYDEKNQLRQALDAPSPPRRSGPRV